MGKSYGNGFVFKTKRSAHWGMAIPWTDEMGKKGRVTKTTRVACHPDRVGPDGSVKPDNRGKTMAEQALRAWHDELVRGVEDGVGSSMPFYSYAKNYVGEKRRLMSVTAMTANGYESMLRQLLGTELGECPIRDVSPDMIRDFEAQLLEDGLSPVTVNKTHVLLKSVCREAVRSDELARNPFERVDPPTRRPKPINSLTVDGLSELNTKLAELDGAPVAVAAKLALMTGMRQGEVCALRWVDVNLKERTLRVEHALSRNKGSYELTAPKTVKSRRVIPFGEALATLLSDRKAKMRHDAREAGVGWDERAFVLGSVEGDWMSPSYLGHQWSSFVRFNKVRGTQGEYLRFHDLRHTFATLAIARGVDVKTVSVILGHASAAMTLDIYADALEDSKRSGMELMDMVLSA